LSKPTSSKNPSIKQLLSMSTKLRKKYNNAACVTAQCLNYSSKNIRVQYSIYLGTPEGIHKSFESWSECFGYYLELMK
jgi:hypothetical protein